MILFRFCLAALAALSLAFAPVAQAQSQRRQLLEYPSIHHPVVGERGMVVTQNAIASEVGAEILRKGGNAVDAAVAVGFALAVTLPRAGNIGGDGFMLVHTAATKETVVIDFRSVAPAAARLEMFVDKKGEESPRPRGGIGPPPCLERSPAWSWPTGATASCPGRTW